MQIAQQHHLLVDVARQQWITESFQLLEVYIKKSLVSYLVLFSFHQKLFFSDSGVWWCWTNESTLLCHMLSCCFFSLSAPQVDCLWRSSLKVPRAIRPLSGCCSRIREPLVSSEDRDNDTHTHTLSLGNPYTPVSIHLHADARPLSHPPSADKRFHFSNTPSSCCVYING